MPKIRKILQIRQIHRQLLAVSDWLLADTNAGQMAAAVNKTAAAIKVTISAASVTRFSLTAWFRGRNDAVVAVVTRPFS